MFSFFALLLPSPLLYPYDFFLRDERERGSTGVTSSKRVLESAAQCKQRLKKDRSKNHRKSHHNLPFLLLTAAATTSKSLSSSLAAPLQTFSSSRCALFTCSAASLPLLAWAPPLSLSPSPCPPLRSLGSLAARRSRSLLDPLSASPLSRLAESSSRACLALVRSSSSLARDLAASPLAAGAAAAALSALARSDGSSFSSSAVRKDLLSSSALLSALSSSSIFDSRDERDASTRLEARASAASIA